MVNKIKPINISQKAMSASSLTNVKNSFFSLFQERLKVSLLRLKLTKPTDFLMLTQNFLNIVTLLFPQY